MSLSATISQLVDPVVALATEVGQQILEVYTQYMQKNILAVEAKSDKTPVTNADLLSHHALIERLQQLTPNLPVLSEESRDISFEQRKLWQRYWLIDPLDGTREFIEKTGEFTINIALIDKHRPVLGVIYAPISQCCYFAWRSGGAFKQSLTGERQAIHTRNATDSDCLIVTASRRHETVGAQNAFNEIPAHKLIAMGSALKFCLIAEGKADIYLRLGPTSEWDTAAGQCIVEEAGGKVFDKEMQVLHYNRKDSLLNPSFFAVGDLQYPWKKYLVK